MVMNYGVFMSKSQSPNVVTAIPRNSRQNKQLTSFSKQQSWEKHGRLRVVGKPRTPTPSQNSKLLTQCSRLEQADTSVDISLCV